MIRRTAAVALLAAIPATALAYPLNPWGAAIPDKTIAINPFLYAYEGPELDPILYAGVGIGGHFDVYGGVSGVVDLSGAGGSGLGTIELFPRFFLSDSVAVTPHFYWTPSDDLLVPAPELHYAGSWDSGFALTINTGWRPDVGYGPRGGSDLGNIFAMVAPEYYFGDQLSLFLEVHDYLYVDGSGENDNIIAPGVWFALDKDQVNSFAIAGQLGLYEVAGATTSDVSAGIWYATTFGIGGGS